MTLPREWCRGPQWASEAARQEWEPALEAARKAWDALETLTVAEGVRPSALVYLKPEELIKATAEAAANGFDVVPLALADSGVRAALCRPALRPAWVAAWRANDHEAIGRLLGFPACCRAHFRATWEAGRTDTVLPMAVVDGPPEANVMHRHLGVRLVPHLPCSAECEATVALGRRTAEVGQAAGLDVEAVYRVLRLPVRYSALHGVAVTETPHFRFLAGTDYTAAPAVARRVAAEEYHGRSGHGGTCSCCHHDAAEVGRSTPPAAPATWQDNGFRTAEGMEVAHATVAAVVTRATVTSALDLGAGDGALLARLAGGRPGAWVGVECEAGRVVRGTARHPGVALVHQRIEAFRWGGTEAFDVALLMPGRLVEMGEEAAARVREWLPRVARRLVLYTYGDQGELRALCARAGLAVVGAVEKRGHVEAAEGRVV